VREDGSVKVHLIDGTYELFRHHFAVPSYINRDGQEVAATRGVLGSLLALLEDGASHAGVATDHVIESFRNELYPGYKTGEGIEPALRSQFELLEDVLEAVGFCVWRMVEYEADDALGAAAAIADADPRVDQVLVCTPDKDLAQCVKGLRVVQVDRRKKTTIDADGVVAKFGVPPASIPDYLALVGDSADGFPGLSGWGAKSASTVLARYGHLEKIPERVEDWDVKVRGASRLAETLSRDRDQALLFRHIATLAVDGPDVGAVDDWLWRGPTEEFEELCDYLDAPRVAKRAARLAATRR